MQAFLTTLQGYTLADLLDDDKQVLQILCAS